VLIEDCVAECASDAGIYVGQSQGVVVRNCVAEKNVAGIEIENCVHADVYGNVAKGNAGGILVFSLPGLTLKNGSDCRVFDNEVADNNHPNFAKKGAMVAMVPPGSGLMVMANDRVEVFGNTFRDNNSAHCLVVSFLVTQREFSDADYDPFPEAIDIHDNTFSGGGSDPQAEFFGVYTAAAGLPLPDIVVDGIVDEGKVEAGGQATTALAIRDNGDATFVNLDLGRLMAGDTPQVSTDLVPYASALPPVSPVEMPGL
jgi:parallel beta-helix repeat protein